MNRNNYYLAIVSGKDADIVGGPTDIAYIDRITANYTEKQAKKNLEIANNQFIPENAEFIIFQVVPQKNQQEEIRILNPIFISEKKDKVPYEIRLETFFPQLAQERINNITTLHKYGTVDNAKAITYTDNDDILRKFGFNELVESILKNLTSNKKNKQQFLNQLKKYQKNDLIKSISDMLYQDTFLNERQIEIIKNHLSNYIALRIFYLNYLYILNPELKKKHEDNNQYRQTIRNEYILLKKELEGNNKKREENDPYHQITLGEFDKQQEEDAWDAYYKELEAENESNRAAISELERQYENGEISWEELQERSEAYKKSYGIELNR